MNSMNYGPAQGQSKKNSVERLIVAGAVVVVATGLILGGMNLTEKLATESFAQSPAATAATLYANPELKVLEYPVAVAAPEASLHANPELKAMDYAAVADKAAVQVVTGWESRLLVFPEALDGLSAAAVVNDLSINPELKVLDYPVAVAAPEATLHDNPELKAMDYAVVADKAAVQVITGWESRLLVFPEALEVQSAPDFTGARQLSPEQRLLDYPFAGSARASQYDYSYRESLGNAAEQRLLDYPFASSARASQYDYAELRSSNSSAEITMSAVDILRPYSNNR